MSKAVLISISPEWVKKILAGEKTLEVRKTRPKLEAPFKVYIYCTAGNLSYEVNNGMMCNISGGKMVVGEFVCDDIIEDLRGENCDILCGQGYMSLAQIKAYGRNKKLYGWHISDLKIYAQPKQLSVFKGLRKTKFGYAPVEIKRPPQSWCYVEELK